MNKILFIPDRWNEHKEYTRITSSGIFFSSTFMRINDLLKHQCVCFYQFKDNKHKFGIEFFKETNVPGAFALVRNGQNSNSAYTTARSFINSVDALKLLVKAKTKNRFKLEYDKTDRCFIFKIIPSFESKDSVGEIPEGIKGIYRYLDSENRVIYIGQGNIKERIRERKDWNIATVEYSVINSKDDMTYYEGYHLNEYEKIYGVLPKYNHNSGTSWEAIFSD